MQQTTGVAVLATHLATTDRRALSEAWYRALHVAEPPLRSRGAVAQPAKPQQRRPAARPEADAAARERVTNASLRATTVPERTRVGGPGIERRAPRTELAKRIERALTRPATRTPRGAFSISAAEGRIHLIVRNEGVRTRIVAVCAPSLRERVERGLAHARFALATHGNAVQAA